MAYKRESKKKTVALLLRTYAHLLTHILSALPFPAFIQPVPRLIRHCLAFQDGRDYLRRAFSSDYSRENPAEYPQRSRNYAIMGSLAIAVSRGACPAFWAAV